MFRREESPDELIILRIKSLDYRLLHVSIERNALVVDLKNVIGTILSVNVERQRLIFQAKVLLNDKRIFEYDLDDDSLVHMVVKPAADQQNTSAGNQTRTRPSTPLPRRTREVTIHILPTDSNVSPTLRYNDFAEYIRNVLGNNASDTPNERRVDETPSSDSNDTTRPSNLETREDYLSTTLALICSARNIIFEGLSESADEILQNLAESNDSTLAQMLERLNEEDNFRSKVAYVISEYEFLYGICAQYFQIIECILRHNAAPNYLSDVETATRLLRALNICNRRAAAILRVCSVPANVYTDMDIDNNIVTETQSLFDQLDNENMMDEFELALGQLDLSFTRLAHMHTHQRTP